MCGRSTVIVLASSPTAIVIRPFDQSVLKDIEKAIRKLNPWLTADVTVEDIDLQIKELEELREEKLREAEGNDN